VKFEFLEIREEEYTGAKVGASGKLLFECKKYLESS
jgi:hypothetical protein